MVNKDVYITIHVTVNMICDTAVPGPLTYMVSTSDWLFDCDDL